MAAHVMQEYVTVHTLVDISRDGLEGTKVHARMTAHLNESI